MIKEQRSFWGEILKHIFQPRKDMTKFQVRIWQWYTGTQVAGEKRIKHDCSPFPIIQEPAGVQVASKKTSTRITELMTRCTADTESFNAFKE